MGFIEDYFINPIIEGTGYNIVNTAVYGILLIIALFIIVRIFKNWGIKTDEKLWLDLLPFVLFGGVARALQDMNSFNFLGGLQYFFVTPLIYFLIFALVIISMAFTNVHPRIVRYVGFVLLALALLDSVLLVNSPINFAMVLAIAAIVYVISFRLAEWKEPYFLDGINKYVLFGQVLDASATVIAISVVGGFSEQHVLPNFLFSFLPVWAFLPIKVLIALGAIYIIERESNKEWNWLLKFAVFALGMGPGTRDVFALLFN